MSVPVGEIIHVFVELIEKSIRPSVDVTVGVEARAFHLRNFLLFILLSRPEKMQRNIVGGQRPASDSPPNAVQHVVAVASQP